MNALNNDFVSIVPDFHGWEVYIRYGNYSHERYILAIFATESEAIDYVGKLDLN